MLVDRCPQQNMEWIYILIPFILGIATQNIHIHYDCYGGGFMNASCPASQQIYPLQVVTGAKNLSLNCPALYSNISNFDQCCKPEDEDSCTGDYVNVDDPFRSFQFHENCIGRRACPNVPVPNMDTAYLNCNQSLFSAQTTFMAMYYNCIDESKIAIIDGTNSLQSNDTVYLQGANNDGEIPAFNVMNNTCSVEAPFCNSTLTIDVLDLRLADDGTDCKQSLTIVDGTRSVTLTCANNINYTVYSVPSQTNYITITFQNSMTVQGGHFWLEFRGISEETVQLHCPARSQEIDCSVSTSTESDPTTVTTTSRTLSTANQSVYESTSTDSVPTTFTTTSTANQTVYGDTPAKNGTDNGKDKLDIIIAVVATLVILSVIVAAILCIWFRKNKRSKISAEKSTGNEKGVSDDIERDQKENNSPQIYQKDSHECPGEEDNPNNNFPLNPNHINNSSSKIKPTHLEPIMSENGDQGSNSKKKKKKKKKKQKDQHTNSTDVKEGIIAVNSQAENALVENEKSEKIQKKKKKKRKRNHPEIDLETQNLDQEQGNTETNQSECNNNQDIQPPSSGNDISGTSFIDDRRMTMTGNYEKGKRHKKSKKKKSKHKHQQEETAKHSFAQHESAGDEVLLNDD